MMPRGTKVEDICNFIREKLVNGRLSNKLTIIDPYIFAYDINNPKKNDINPSEILIQILKPIENNFQKLELIFDKDKKSNLPEQHSQYLKNNLNVDVKISRSQAFHDRFWIIDDRVAFMVGASATGFGKKHFFIPNDFFNQEDTQELLKIYRKDTQ